MSYLQYKTLEAFPACVSNTLPVLPQFLNQCVQYCGLGALFGFGLVGNPVGFVGAFGGSW